MITLKIGDVVLLNGRAYKVDWSKYSNGKSQGNRAILKLFTKEEMQEILFKKFQDEVKNNEN